MSQKGVIFFKILIFEFSGFFWNLFRFVIEFLGVISLFKITKRGLFAHKTRRADVARCGTRGGATRAHADACMVRTCGARQTRGVATRAHANTCVAPTWHEGLRDSE